MDPAYDLTDPYDADRFLDGHATANYQPPGSEWGWVKRVASLGQFTDPRPDRLHHLTADEAAAGLTLIHAVRHWLAELEPEFIEAARREGATWEKLSHVLGVGDRRAAQRRAKRLRAATGQPAATFATSDAIQYRISRVYRTLAEQPGAPVRLDELHRLLYDLPRADVDAALIAMYTAQTINLTPSADQAALTDDERAAGLQLGGEIKHLISIE
jgi:hypothetical protein